MEGLIEEYSPIEVYADRMTGGIGLVDLMKWDMSIPLKDFTGKIIRRTGNNFFFDNIKQEKYKFAGNNWLRWELRNAHIKEFPDGGIEIVRAHEGSKLGIDGVYSVIHGSFPFVEFVPDILPENPEHLDKILDLMYS